MTISNKEGKLTAGREQSSILPTAELSFQRWGNILDYVANKFTVNTFGEEPDVEAVEEFHSPLKFTHTDNCYRWQWREVSPVEGGKYSQYMEMFLVTDIYEGEYTGEAKIYLFPETGVKFDGKYAVIGDLENVVHWKCKSIKLNDTISTIDTVAVDFGEALSRVWSAIDSYKERAPTYIKTLRAEV